jgi:DNA-binding NarL/FixJ family response regulator
MMRAPVTPEPTQPVLSRADLQDIAQELADLAGQIEDEALRTKVEALRSRFAPAPAPTASVGPPALAPREIDVLQEVARGLRNREVAEALGLQPNTVKAYLKTAMRKLHASNRVQAIVIAREAGLIR